MSIFEQALRAFGSELLSTGERRAKLRALSLFVDFLAGCRRVTLMYIYSIVASSVFLASLLSAALYEVMLHDRTGSFRFDFFFGTSIFVCALSLGTTIWLLGEKRWLEMFHIPERLRSIVKPVESERIEEVTGIDYDRLGKMIDHTIARAVEEHIGKRERAANSAMRKAG
jgi:hypothetical protein